MEKLRDRSLMLEKSRTFFREREILEVDCPSLGSRASIDAHIDLITAQCASGELRYLHSSPEYCMKRLLSEGMGDIFQLSHVYRAGEQGERHNPEFTLVEWYRTGWNMERMIEETCDFIMLFLGNLKVNCISYRKALLQFAGIDYVKATKEDLLQTVSGLNLPPYHDIEKADKDDLLNFILAETVEPNLGKNELTVLTHYPATQAALAKIVQIGDEAAAERFEIYYKGSELANGYHELTDKQEQTLRFAEANKKRDRLGKSALPQDELFLEALDNFPPCSGVAVGFDRLMMLRHNTGKISDILPFSWVDC